MLDIAICDDRTEDRERLHMALKNHLSIRRQEADLALYPSGEALLAGVEEDGHTFDVIFLDIYMAGLTGMETARRLRAAGQKTPIVFLTSSPDFAVEGYEVAAAGYLLKPLDAEKLSALLERLLAPIPHVLLGGSTGSGKSVLLKLLLMPALRKGGGGLHSRLQGRRGLPQSMA